MAIQKVTDMFAEEDEQFMTMALQEAAGDFPVGAVLVVNGVLWGKGRNGRFTEGRTVSHAEHNLLDACSARLHSLRFDPKGREAAIHLYTTLEPCLEPMLAEFEAMRQSWESVNE